MAVDPSISLNIKPYDATQKLSDMLGVAQGVQGYQANQIGLQKARALLQPAIDQGVAQAQSAQAAAQVDQANVQPLIQQQQALTQQHQTAAQNAATDYQAKRFDIANDAYDALAQDPAIKTGKSGADITDAINRQRDLAIQRGADREQTYQMANTLQSAALKDPASVQNMILEHQKAIIGAQGQVAQDLVPAGQQQTYGTNVVGQPVINQRDQYGNIQQQQTLPQSNQAGAPAQNTQFPAGEDAGTAKQLQDERAAAQNAAAAYPNQHSNNQQIADILEKSKLAPAGNGSGWLAAIGGSVVGQALHLTGDYATDYNTLSHLNAQQTQQGEQAMGVKTDAGRATASAATGDQTMDRDALLRATKLNDATQLGVKYYSQGMENAIQNGGNIFAVRQYKNAWTKNYNPQVMLYMNAVSDNDSVTKQQVLDGLKVHKPDGSLGDYDLNKLGAFKKNIKNMDALIKTGRLPNGR